MNDAFITSPAGVLAVLAAVTSLFFFLEKKTRWKLFHYFPPLVFIYIIPVLLSNMQFILPVKLLNKPIIPTDATVYDFMKNNMLPFFLVIMLLKVDFLKTVRIMGKGVFVMLAGTAGVVIGAPVAFLLVKHGLDDLGGTAWKVFGTLAGSWIGGTGNMAATGVALELDEKSLAYGYPIIADNAVYLVWLPILLTSKNFADRFNRFTGISAQRVQSFQNAASTLEKSKEPIEMHHVLYLAFLGFSVTAGASWLAAFLPELPSGEGVKPFITVNTYKILIVTLSGILLSFTKAGSIPGSHAFSLALVYLFVARMGAKADLSKLNSSIIWFLAGAYIWIFFHGFFLVIAARIFKVDVHTAAIASAANIGGAASAPIVAAHHNAALVPVSILMALLGYAVGTPAAILAGFLCKWIS